MPIKNSVRNVLPGLGTSGLRGGSISGASPLTISVPMGMSMGKFRFQSTAALTTVLITGSDGTNTQTIFSETLAGTGQTSIVGEFMSDLNLTSFTCTGTGTMDFEVWGQPGAV